MSTKDPKIELYAYDQIVRNKLLLASYCGAKCCNGRDPEVSDLRHFPLSVAVQSFLAFLKILITLIN
jgi:hypothetical protein